MSERQLYDAIDMLRRYAALLDSHDIDIEPIMANPKCRVGKRTLDHIKTITIDDDMLRIVVPFDAMLFTEIDRFAIDNLGDVNFVRLPVASYWKMPVIEKYVEFAVALGIRNNFTISDELRAMYRSIVDSRAAPYRIELRKLDNALTISNAPSSLITHIETNLGGFDVSNTVRLVDCSAELGYSVSQDIIDGLTDPAIAKFALKRVIRCRPSEDRLSELFDYAITNNRFPIVSADTPSYVIDMISNYFTLSEIATDPADITDETKIILCVANGGVALTSKLKSIPLLLCYTSMMFGTQKAILLQQSLKVCYYCNIILTES